MFQPYPLFISSRYTSLGHRGFISFISLIAVAGLALGVAALITVLSVMNGFHQELQSRILGMVAHATIYTPGSVTDWQQPAAVLRRDPQVLDVAPFVQGEGMLMQGASLQAVLVKGVLPTAEARISIVDEKMQQGSLDALRGGAYGMLLGDALARKFGVRTGDTLTLVVPELRTGLAGVIPRLKRFTVAGVFSVGMYEFDSSVALVHMEDAARLYTRGGSEGLSLLTTDLVAAPVISRRAAAALPTPHAVIDWTQRHSSFFRALKTEKAVMFVILMLIIAVAAFNIVSMLTMLVNSKRRDIAVLRAMGAGAGGILSLFVVHGMLVGLAGILIGALGGCLLADNVAELVAWLEGLLGVDFVPAEVYFLNELPSELHWPDVVRTSAAAFALAVVATIYPSLRAAAQRPAEVLRHE